MAFLAILITNGLRRMDVKKLYVLLSCALLFAGCVLTTEKSSIEPPWNPDAQREVVEFEPPVDEVVPVYWVETPPAIDADFSEWENLDGPVTRIVVFGAFHDPKDAEARFVLKADAEHLYIYARVTDDRVNENKLPGGLAWRGDSVEIFFGTDTSNHANYRGSDSHIRIVPKDREDPFNFELAVNDITQTERTTAAVIFNEDGYEIEAALPLQLLRIDSLKPGQRIRCEFQVNDADTTERDRLIHWMSERDDPWYDASVWGWGQVTE